jgi:hypothetical protein
MRRLRTRNKYYQAMTTPSTDGTPGPLVDSAGEAGSALRTSMARPNQAPIFTKGKNHNICVAPAVLDASRRDGESGEVFSRVKANGGDFPRNKSEVWSNQMRNPANSTWHSRWGYVGD